MKFDQKIYYTKHKNLNNIDPKSLNLQMVPKKMKLSHLAKVCFSKSLFY